MPDRVITIDEAVEILRKHNEWRRDNTSTIPQPMVSPRILGIAIDTIIAYHNFDRYVCKN